MEQFRPIKGCLVSNLGRVMVDGKIVIPYRKQRRDRVIINGKDLLVHRLVAEAFIGEFAGHIKHKDGNTYNNSVDNLQFCPVVRSKRIKEPAPIEYKEYESYYVTPCGKVYSPKAGVYMKRIYRPGRGYAVCLKIKGRSTTRYIHKLMAELYLYKPEGATKIVHIDGNRFNNDVDNLQWV